MAYPCPPRWPTLEELDAYLQQIGFREVYEPNTEGWTSEDYEWYEPIWQRDIDCWQHPNQAWSQKFSREFNCIAELTDWIEKKIECNFIRSLRHYLLQ